MRIIIETIDHDLQEYSTVGNYWTEENGDWHIVVSKMGDWRKEFLVAIHELSEMALCKERGITDGEITAFDVEFEDRRKPGDLSEPGDSREAPYSNEHCAATAVERMMCAALSLPWQDYENTIFRLLK